MSVFEFADRDGVRRRLRSKTAWSPARHAVGQRVRVSYEPARSDDAEIVADSGALLLLALFGAFLALLALLLLWGLWIGAFTIE